MRSLEWQYGLVPRIDPVVMRIRDGRVACPSRGEVDVEACFSCSHMLNAAGNGDGSIVCEYPVDTVASSDAPPSKI